MSVEKVCVAAALETKRKYRNPEGLFVYLCLLVVEFIYLVLFS